MKRFAFALALALSIHQASGQTFQGFLDRVTAAPDSQRMALVDSFVNALPAFPFIEADTLAHFIYRGAASSISVPGDANGWDGSAFPMMRLSTTDLWYRTQSFEAEARLDYKFVLNGSTWILDPRNPRQVWGGFGPNSELRMPDYPPAPEVEFYPGIPHGTLWDTTYYSINLGNSRRIRIYTPPGYETSTNSFPMILFHDGLEYVSLAQANNTIDYLISLNRIRPVIAVFVPPVNRTPEYAGNQQALFGAFIVNEILPFVDARFRTRRNPSSRATLGASNGGNISLYLGYTYPGHFGNVAAQSSYIQPSLVSGFQSSPRLNLNLYLDLGTYDIAVLIPLVRNFIPVLQSKGYPYRYVEYHEGHSWGNWRAHVDNALERFFPGPALGITGSTVKAQGFALEQNFPNPFNPGTSFEFRVPSSELVTLKVFDLLGREVATLVNEVKSPGTHTLRWNASNLPSGLYFYRLTTESQSQTRKLVLVK